MRVTKCQLILVVLLFTSYNAYTQTGIISSRVWDNGQPVIGANVYVKGTTHGTITNIDGEYSIECSVGDILVVSYTGFNSIEIPITTSYFKDKSISKKKVRKEPVKPITSSDFTRALSARIEKPNIPLKTLFYSGNNLHNIKKIGTLDNVLLITPKKRLWHYNVEYANVSLLRKVPESRIPALQSEFSQGRPLNGELAWMGPQDGEIFSFGPPLSSLSYDGAAYMFDPNGRLVIDPAGEGVSPYQNQVFGTTFKQSHILSAQLFSDKDYVKLNYTTALDQPIFGSDMNVQNRIEINAGNDNGAHRYSSGYYYNIKSSYSHNRFNRANINGLFNEVYRQMLIAPPTFNNSLNIADGDGNQVSFSSEKYNHPRWLIDQGRSSRLYDEFLFSAKGRAYFSNNIELKAFGLYASFNDESNFELCSGFINPPLSAATDKSIKGNSLSYGYTLSKQFNSIYVNQDLRVSNSKSTYELDNYKEIIKPSTDDVVNRYFQRTRTVANVSNRLRYADYRRGLSFQVQQNMYLSSIQESHWFLPSVTVKWNWMRTIPEYRYSNFDNSEFKMSFSQSVVEAPLIYESSNHASILLDPTVSYLVNDNLEIPINDVLLEKHKIFDVSQNLTYNYGNSVLYGGIDYKKVWVTDAVFPIIENNIYSLRNVADINHNSLGFQIGYKWSRFNHWDDTMTSHSKLTLSKYTTKVVRIIDNKSSISIAGIEGISQSLVVDQPAGVILGTSYQRNSLGDLIIGDDGFPLVSNESETIGDPTPDLALSFYQSFEYKSFSFSMLLDAQVGGEYWSGTQQVLNYHGTSQESADLRGVTDYIYPGLTTNGGINETPVSFASPESSVFENRWTRNGYLGVGEDGIKDASFFRISSLRFSYSKLRNRYRKLVKEWKIGVFSSNIILLSQVQGYNPTSSLYGVNTVTAIDYFNLPMPLEVGFFVEIKI